MKESKGKVTHLKLYLWITVSGQSFLVYSGVSNICACWTLFWKLNKYLLSQVLPFCLPQWMMMFSKEWGSISFVQTAMAGNFCIWNQVDGFLFTPLHLPGIHIFWSSPAPVSALDNVWLIDESWQLVGDSTSLSCTCFLFHSLKFLMMILRFHQGPHLVGNSHLAFPRSQSISRFRFHLVQMTTSRSRNFLRNPEESPLPSRLQPISCIECFLDILK